MTSTPGARVLIFGTGRSGTSWTAKVLGATRDTTLVFEPEHVNAGLTGVKANRGRGVTTVLVPGDRAPRPYIRLWNSVLGHAPVADHRLRNRVARRLAAPFEASTLREVWSGRSPTVPPRLRVALWCAAPPRPRPDRPVVVKTVASVLAVEWILARWSPTGVWVRRNPLDVVASRHALDMRIDLERIDAAMATLRRRPEWYWPPPEGTVARYAWYTGLTMSWCRDVVAARPDVVQVAHEELCADPIGRFRDLAGAAGLEWSADAERRVREMDAPGSGWVTRRVSGEQGERWRARLTPEEQDVAIDVLARFPITEDHAELR